MDRLQEIAHLLADRGTSAALSVENLKNLRAEVRELGQAIGAGTVEVADQVAALGACVRAVEAVDALVEAKSAQADRAAELVSQLSSGPTLPSTAAMAAARPRDAAPVVTGAEPVVFDLLHGGEYASVDDFVTTVIEAHDDLMAAFGTVDESRPIKQRLGRFTRGAFPEDRVLHGSEVDDNTKISRVLHGAELPSRWNDPEYATLTASGGFCAPAMPDFDIPLIAGTQRPVHDALPAFAADRGQVISIVPPALSSVKTSTGQTAGSAVSVWPNSTDTTPGGATKPSQVLPCPTNVTTAAEAIVEQLTIGNFEARAFPELVQTWMGLAAAAWARRAEGQLLNGVHTNSTAQVTTPQVLGTTRDIFGWLPQAAALLRYRQRMPRDAQLRAFLPAVLIDMVAADIARQQPGDAGGDLSTTLGVTAAQVEAWVRASNVQPVWYEDVSDSVSAAELARYAGAQGNTELKEFPLTVRWWLAPVSAFALLDAGTLDLGIVRDSTLDSTNDYKFFTESFEGVIPHVVEAVEVASTLSPLGTAPALVSDAGAYFASAS